MIRSLRAVGRWRGTIAVGEATAAGSLYFLCGRHVRCWPRLPQRDDRFLVLGYALYLAGKGQGSGSVQNKWGWRISVAEFSPAVLI